MTTRIALLRGINVGGHHKLSMAELRQLVEATGGKDVRSYIQSGNLVFRGDLSGAALGEAIEAAKGWRPDVQVIEADTFLRILEANPFPEAEEEPKTLHLFFLAAPSSTDPAELESRKVENERFVLTDEALYLHTPDKISSSKIAEKMERLLGVSCTARNWRTCLALKEMIEGGRA